MQINELRQLIQEVKIREALQKGITQVQNPFKVVFIFGPAGAGKTFIKDTLGLPDNFIGINTDELVEDVFPRYGLSLNFEEGPQVVKQELRKLLQQATANKMRRHVNKCLPLLIDTPGEKVPKMQDIVRALVEIGYDVAIFQINVPPDFSVMSDQKRGEEGERTVGREQTRQIANKYQTNVVRDGAYLQLGQERGVTLLSDKVYPNIFNVRAGTIRDDFDVSMTQDDRLELKDPRGERRSRYMQNPFQGATWDEASKILVTAQTNLSKWLAPEAPLNPTGRVIYDALKYIQGRGVGTLGDEITDIAQYGAEHMEDPETFPMPPEVDEALYMTMGKSLQTKIKRTAPASKAPELDPRYSPLRIKYQGPDYTKKGAPTAKDIVKEETLSLQELREFVDEFNIKHSRIK